METAGHVFRRAAAAAFLLISIFDTPLRAVEPTADDKSQTADIGLPPTIDPAPIPRPYEPIVGVASFYDYSQETASGEEYDPKAITAAAQLEIRERFGGIRFGRLYQPAYAIAEHAGKKLIIKFNDVGPLRPGRKFDLSRAAMEYFDGIEKGLLDDFKVTPLPLGRIYATGPVTEADLIALGIGETPTGVAQPAPGAEPPVLTREAAASAAAEPQPEAVPAPPHPIDDFVPAPIGDVADLSLVRHA